MEKVGVLLIVIVLFFGCQKTADNDFEREVEMIKQEYGLEVLLKKGRTFFDVFETLEGEEAKSHIPLSKFFHFDNKKISRGNGNIKEAFETFARHKYKYDLRKEDNESLIDSTKVFSIIQVLKSKTEDSSLSNDEQFLEMIFNLDEFPIYFSQAKRIIKNPSKEKLEYAIKQYSKDYFYLKDELSLLIRKPDILKGDQIDFSKKNEEAQLAVKDFIAFLNSQLFELGE